jgi:hypothetical protein
MIYCYAAAIIKTRNTYSTILLVVYPMNAPGGVNTEANPEQVPPNLS